MSMCEFQIFVRIFYINNNSLKKFKRVFLETMFSQSVRKISLKRLDGFHFLHNIFRYFVK